MPSRRRLLQLLVLVPAIPIGIAWGWDAALTYLVVALIVGALALATVVGGDWVRDASRGRFDRPDDR